MRGARIARKLGVDGQALLEQRIWSYDTRLAQEICIAAGNCVSDSVMRNGLLALLAGDSSGGNRDPDEREERVGLGEQKYSHELVKARVPKRKGCLLTRDVYISGPEKEGYNSTMDCLIEDASSGCTHE